MTKSPASPRPGARAKRPARPRKHPSDAQGWKESIERVLAEKTDKKFARYGETYRDALVRAAIQHAIEGNASILRQLFDRSEGKVGAAGQKPRGRRPIQIVEIAPPAPAAPPPPDDAAAPPPHDR
ncbi:MAG: hypothetical protein HY259_00100 [Chloroflexi bacterium]|nr:hypothetical protein [Chloroflexota bacterium]